MISKTVAALVAAVSGRSGLPKNHVEQRARQLQDSGYLPLAKGRSRPAVTARDLAYLLIGLAANRVRVTPAFVGEYAGLRNVGTKETLADGIERVVESIWRGDRSHVRESIALQLAPANPFATVAGQGFHSRDKFVAENYVDTVRPTFEIPCRLIAMIGYDLGHEGCAYAL